MKRLLRGAAIALVVAGAVACVKQDWQVKYTGIDDYSNPYALAVGADDRVYVAGGTGEQGYFVAAYDDAGGFLWDQVFLDDARLLRQPGAQTVVVGSEGEVFLSALDRDSFTTRIFKFDSQGQLIRQWESPQAALALSLTLGPDGALYATRADGKALDVYSQDGDHLWSHLNAPISTVAESPNVPSGSALLATGGILAFINEERLLLANDELLVFDAAGSVVSRKMPEDYGMIRFHQVGVSGDTVILVGQRSNGVQVLQLNANLDVTYSGPVYFGDITHATLAIDGANICVGALPWRSDGRDTLLLQPVAVGKPTGWIGAVPIDQQQLGHIDVKASGVDCYVGMASADTAGKVTSRVLRFGKTGRVVDTIELKDNAMTTFVVKGRTILQAGVTGEYDGTPSVATITRHTHSY